MTTADAIAKVEKLEINPGDVVLIQTTESRQVEEGMADAFSKLATEKKCLIIFTKPGTDVRTLNEGAMRQQGWIKSKEITQ